MPDAIATIEIAAWVTLAFSALAAFSYAPAAALGSRAARRRQS